jgi:outer membrane protein OmpA-like peptidoglycan-associated protein
MKKLLLSIFTICSLNALAQDNLGLLTGNYAGVTGLTLQPANVADNRYKFDINLASASVNFDNNYLGFTRSYFINNRFSFKDYNSFADFKKNVLVENNLGSNKAYFNVNNRVMLPSFMLTTGKKSGIALTIQNRTSIAMQDVDAGFAKQVYDLWKYQPTQGTFYDVSGLKMNAMNWMEVGLTYGRVLVDANKHFLKFGITPKYLGGISSWNLNAKDLKIRADKDSFMTANGTNIEYSRSKSDISTKINTSYRPDASSFGGDIGFVYEFRGRIDKFKFMKLNKRSEELDTKIRRDKNKYSFKVGVSLVDVGTLKFKSAPLARNFNINSSNFNMWALDIRNIQQFDTVLASNVTYTGAAGEEYTVALPTALSAQLDLHLMKGFYVNAMGYAPFTALNKDAKFRIPAPKFVAITPRWESRFMGLYVPITINDKKDVMAGATFRFGPAFIGTNNLLTLIKKDNIQGADVHAGLKLPLAFGKQSKTAAWFKKMKSKVASENTETKIDNETIELKKTETIATEIKKDEPSIQNKETIIEKKEVFIEKKNDDSKKMIEPKSQQPIQIIINNYNSSGASKPGEIMRMQGGIDIQENTINIDDMNELQMQIEMLKRKVEQKEMLIDELEKNQSNINSNSNETGSKKKIDSLRNLYLSDDNAGVFTPALSYNMTTSQKKAEVTRMLSDLNRLQEKDELLNKRITKNELNLTKETTIQNVAHANMIRGNYDVLKRKISMDERRIVQLESVRSLQRNKLAEEPLTRRPRLTLPNIEEVKSVEVANVQTMPKVQPLQDLSNLMTKKDAQTLMTKQEYENLRKEIASLKEDMKKSTKAQMATTAVAAVPSRGLFRRRNKVINNYSQLPQTQVVKEIEVKIVRDTIYIDKPIEKIVERIVRDTIVNTIEKNNVITKTEQKEVFTNNDRANLLDLDPEVVLFDVGQSMVKPVYNAKLTSLVKKSMKFPELKFHLKGHTDASGNAAKNLALSQARANAVKKVLMNRGLTADRIVMDASGADNPIAENTTSSGKSQNRRVEVDIMEN